MKADDFLSTPDDLLAAAIVYGTSLENSGWRVKIEPYDLAFPRTPPLTAKRAQTVQIVEVQSRIDLFAAREWSRYCKTCSKDTRICIGLIEGVMPTPEEIDAFRELGVGLYRIGTAGPHELVAPQDLAMQFDPPELPAQLRRLLGEAYDHFTRGLWREGFESAATVLEQEARKYLRLHSNRGRISFFSSAGKTITYTNDQIGKMTMGALARAFSEIQTPNLADSRIGQALSQVNADRITVAHYRGTSAAREKKLRANVPKHMFVVINGLRYLRNIK